MPMERSHKQEFLDSLNRCSQDDQFMAMFYRRFLATSPEVRKKFRDTEFSRQERVLLRSLQLSASATDGDPVALRELHSLAESHDRHHLDIRPELYEYWLDALVETAWEFDPEWNPQIEESWRHTLGHVIHHMIRNY